MDCLQKQVLSQRERRASAFRVISKKLQGAEPLHFAAPSGRAAPLTPGGCPPKALVQGTRVRSLPWWSVSFAVAMVGAVAGGMWLLYQVGT